jgi:hypothetical protein
MIVTIETNVYAIDEHDHPSLPYPMPADSWMWQRGDRWVAVVGTWHEDWWEGADPEDIEARPVNWCRHILDVPTTGTLTYLDAQGNEHSEHATGERPFSVGLNMPESNPVSLARFNTHDEAAAFIDTLEGADDGRYYLDGPADD